MDRIVLEVDDISAKKWRYASKEKKSQLNNTINRILKNAFDKNEDDFWQFLDKVGKKAAENGLTEQQLDQLLSED
jgi:predicted Zn-dependent protease